MAALNPYTSFMRLSQTLKIKVTGTCMFDYKCECRDSERGRGKWLTASLSVVCLPACLSVCMITSQLSSCLLFFSLQYVRMHSPQSSLPSQALLWRKRGVKSSPMQCKSWRRKTALWRWLVVSAQRIIFIYILDTESRGYIRRPERSRSDLAVVL